MLLHFCITWGRCSSVALFLYLGSKLCCCILLFREIMPFYCMFASSGGQFLLFCYVFCITWGDCFAVVFLILPTGGVFLLYFCITWERGGGLCFVLLLHPTLPWPPKTICSMISAGHCSLQRWDYNSRRARRLSRTRGEAAVGTGAGAGATGRERGPG